MREFGLQLVRFGSEDAAVKFPENGWEMANLWRVSPLEVGRFMQSRQQEGTLSGPIFLLNKIYYFFFWLSALILFVFLLKRGAGFGEEKKLAVTLALFLVANAFVCGVASGASDRYQSRLAWLPIFVVLLILARWYDRRASA